MPGAAAVRSRIPPTFSPWTPSCRSRCSRRTAKASRSSAKAREDTDIAKLNAADGAEVTLSDEGAKLLSLALDLSAATNGAYDPTVAPLTDLWGIGTDHQKVPSQSEIDAALQTVGTAHVHESGDAVTLDSGSKIDLGGIAKGYAADLCADILKSADADGLLVLGGNIYAVGTNEGKDWNIGIADPDDSTDTIAAVAVHDLSVVTSGDYERYFEQDGVRYHHIFDPKTGYPAASGLRSVTVIDANSTRADALTTALFVMGADKGRAYCEENGIAAVFVTADKQVFTTSRVADVCTFTFTGEDKGYTYAQ